jgi:hypothetical protein
MTARRRALLQLTGAGEATGKQSSCWPVLRAAGDNKIQ